jgi:hypothetical protein
MDDSFLPLSVLGIFKDMHPCSVIGSCGEIARKM